MSGPVAIYPASSVFAQASAAIATLAGSSFKLLKVGFDPQFASTLAQVLAAEADFSGYPTGGLTLATWLGPMLSPGAGAAIIGPQTFFVRDGTLPGVNNVIGSWALVTAGNVLWALGSFPQAVTFQLPGQGISIPVAFGFPSG